jgi:DNA topoisomerase-1
VLDRLVGFELSPVLWRKLSAAQSLSAGRVQSVAVRLIVEKEREIINFKESYAYRTVAVFQVTDKGGKQRVFKAELGQKLKEEQDAVAFLNSCKGAAYSVKSLEVKPTKRTPAAPFTTSTLQQEASRKLGFGVTKTMIVAQKLYESGKITYMRTDSVNMSAEAAVNAEAEIKKSFGDAYASPRQFKNKNSSAQEAHEAIRPTYFENHTTTGERDEQRLYELIWKRAVASQMADAQLEKTSVVIAISTNQNTFNAGGEMIRFDGFLKLYIESDDADEDNDDDAEESSSTLLPPLTVGQTLPHIETKSTQKFSRHTARFTEASLVKKMEELGIGRPSTYAPTIGTVQKRLYVVKKDKEGYERKFQILTYANDKLSTAGASEIANADRNKLFPTDLGMLTNDFLYEHFKNIMDYTFTARIEQEFDEIANGKMQWQQMIKDFYVPFHETVELTSSTAKRVSGERLLGNHPETGKPVFAKMGRFGPMIQIGKIEIDENAPPPPKGRKKKVELPEGEKPLFSKLKTDQSLDTITLEEALQLFNLPRTLGEYEVDVVKVNDGRFGPYIVHNKVFVSLKKTDDPYTITMDRAIELIEEKRNQTLREFEGTDMKILNGRWGPYLKAGKKNVKLPKDANYDTITEEECMQLANDAPEKKGRRFPAKK